MPGERGARSASLKTLQDDHVSMIGQTLSHYRIVEKIGAGGMGVVYRAHDEQLDRDVAVKVLPAGRLTDKVARKQFRKEALALARLNHPNIETVHEFGTQDGVDFLVMENIRGELLSDKLTEGVLPEQEAVRLGIQLAEGLAAAHEQGVVHRDLKPGNLMITPDGRVKILDFGLAKLLHPELPSDMTRSITVETGSVSGTVPYMAPEQLRGFETDARSDIYASGAVLYEMATGQRAFPEEQSALLIDAILNQTPAPPSTRNPCVTPALESVILKALEKEPSRRYQSAREFHGALEGLAGGFAGAPSKPVPITAIALVLVMVAGVAAYFFIQRSAKEEITLLNEAQQLEQQKKWPEALADYEKLAGGHDAVAKESSKQVSRLKPLLDRETSLFGEAQSAESRGNIPAATQLYREVADLHGEMEQKALGAVDRLRIPEQATDNSHPASKPANAPRTGGVGRPSATKNSPREVESGKCHLNASAIASQLGRADMNRARGNYADAIREYTAVLECDPKNEQAQTGLTKAKAAEAVPSPPRN